MYYTWFWIGRKLSLEVLSLQDMDKEHSRRRVDVTVSMWSRPKGGHCNVDFKQKEIMKAEALQFFVYVQSSLVICQEDRSDNNGQH